jgi:predicted GNAT superfamily acetyltransferase
MSINQLVLTDGAPKIVPSDLVLRRVTNNDLESVLSIAASVGKSKKDHRKGFLMDDYSKNYDYFKDKFKKNISKLDYFYVAEYHNKILGFLMAYDKEQWLEEVPNWLFDIHWNPGFEKGRLKKFVLIDKTAVWSNLTGRGVGSALYHILFDNLKREGIVNVFSETIISPKPNFASLEFRLKQNYNLAGTRFEEHNGQIYTTLVYHKKINQI